MHRKLFILLDRTNHSTFGRRYMAAELPWREATEFEITVSWNVPMTVQGI